MRFRGTGKELGCGMLVGVALIIMGIWLLFYGLTYIWYALGSLGAGLFFTLFLGMLLRNQRRWEGNQGER